MKNEDTKEFIKLKTAVKGFVTTFIEDVERDPVDYDLANFDEVIDGAVDCFMCARANYLSDDGMWDEARARRLVEGDYPSDGLKGYTFELKNETKSFEDFVDDDKPARYVDFVEWASESIIEEELWYWWYGNAGERPDRQDRRMDAADRYAEAPDGFYRVFKAVSMDPNGYYVAKMTGDLFEAMDAACEEFAEVRPSEYYTTNRWGERMKDVELQYVDVRREAMDAAEDDEAKREAVAAAEGEDVFIVPKIFWEA